MSAQDLTSENPVSEFDYIVVNDDVSRATDEILGIIESIR